MRGGATLVSGAALVRSATGRRAGVGTFDSAAVATGAARWQYLRSCPQRRRCVGRLPAGLGLRNRFLAAIGVERRLAE